MKSTKIIIKSAKSKEVVRRMIKEKALIHEAIQKGTSLKLLEQHGIKLISPISL
jgi:hypothetical protein